MRKLLLIIIVLLGLQGYAQKIFEVYNFTSQPVQLTDIITRASVSFLEYRSVTLITLPAGGGSYTLENASNQVRFPFHSPASSPYIGIWRRYIVPSSYVSVSSNDAWVAGSNQVFDRMVFNIGGLGYSINTTNTAASPVTGPGFTAEYSMYTSGTLIIYTIVIY